MGNGASMEDGQGTSGYGPGPHGQQQQQQHHHPPNSGRVQSARGSMGSRYSMGQGSMTSVATWRSAFRSGKVPATGLRKVRAAALGRKSACTVTIDKTGFSLQHIRICEGQVVTFEWEVPEGTQGFNVTQVCHDGDQYRPVIGGFNSGPLSAIGYYEQQFNLAGEYKFVSAGIRCTPLKVEVYNRKEVEADLSDEGFSPKIIRIDEGNAILWQWSGCSVPHSIFEVKFSHKTGTLLTKDNIDKPIPTKAGSLKKEFPKPGLYYYQTEGVSSGIMHTCIVHVRERQREHRVEVGDRSFTPSILVIQEGDRVWWQWDKEKCKAYHCIYQIQHPPVDAPSDEAYKPYKNGFKWPNPSKSGVLSNEFYEAGVYYFSDQNFNEAAEYIGTIIVKPKQVEHFIEIGHEGFGQDLVYAETGDRIWWAWKADHIKSAFMVSETEKCVSSVASRPSLEDENSGEGSYVDEEIENLKVAAELDTVQLGAIGCYHYKLRNANNDLSTCSIIVQGGPRSHTVHVTDTGFEPKVVTIHPGDRVWWVWQSGKKQHNIIQVSHQGNHIKGGFCSGSTSDAPGAFMHRFVGSGVYYYISSGVSKAFGAVVVASHPKAHEVQVTGTNITPDPIVIACNDVIAWTFKGLRQHDVVSVNTVDQLLDAQFNSPSVAPRRCLSRVFTEVGVRHFTSKSFLKQGKKDQARQNDETRVSSIIVDEVSDNYIVRVTAQGFHPKSINVRKGQSVLWTWKESGEEAHNIINVNPPDSDKPLSVIQGDKSFNSGRPIPKNSFLYTFDEPGTYCVASQGAPGFAGNVNVLPDADRADTPEIVSDRTGGTVEKLHMVMLECATPDASIYYTLDGTAPELHKATPKLYSKQKGIVLKNSGLCFIRAMAVVDGALNSEIYTSKRFWVLSGDTEAQSESEPEQPVETETVNHMKEWWACVPVIKGVFTGAGILETFWDPPPAEAIHLIRGYQVTLNNVAYCDVFPPKHNSLNLAGLAGGRMYEIILEVFPKDSMYLPHKSNKLIMKCPKTTSTGGPLISLESTPKPDMLAIVWMAISTPEYPIAGYRVYLNGQMCGNQVVPDANSDRCKVVIEGCALKTIYRIVVAAIPGTGPNSNNNNSLGQKMSNELEVTLPLDISGIRLPPPELRLDDEDLYKEYVEVRDGASYQGDEPSSIPEQPPQTIDLTGGSPQTQRQQGHQYSKKLQDIPEEPTMDSGRGNYHEGEGYAQHGGDYAADAYYDDYDDQDGDYEDEEDMMGDQYDHTDNQMHGYNQYMYEQPSNQMQSYNQDQYHSQGQPPGKRSSQDHGYSHQGYQRPSSQASDRKQSLGQVTNQSYEQVHSQYQSYGQITSANQSYGQIPYQNQSYDQMASHNQSYGQIQNQNQPYSRYPNQNQPYGQSPRQHSGDVPERPAPLSKSYDTSYKSYADFSKAGKVEDSRRGSLSKSANYADDYDGKPMMEYASSSRKGSLVKSSYPEYDEKPMVEYETCSRRGSLGKPLKRQMSRNQPLVVSQVVESPYEQEATNSFPAPTPGPKVPPVPPLWSSANQNKPPPTAGLTVTSAGFLASHVTLQTQSFINPDAPPMPMPLNKRTGQMLTSPSTNQLPQPSVPYNLLQGGEEGHISLPPAGNVNYPGQPGTPHGGLTGMSHVALPPTGHGQMMPPIPHYQIPPIGGQYTIPPGGVPGYHGMPPGQYPVPPGSAPGHYTMPPVPQQQRLHTPHTPSSGYSSGQAPPGSRPPPPPEGPLIQGVRYQSHILEGYGAPPPEVLRPEETGFIDATRGGGRMEDVYGGPQTHGIEVEVQDDGSDAEFSEHHKRHGSRRSKKRRSKNAVVEVQDGAHLQLKEAPAPTATVIPAVPILGAQEGQDSLLPAPVVSAENHGNEDVLVRWHFTKDAGPMYRNIVNVVNVIGPRFKKEVNSNISFECLQEERGEAVNAVQHCWNVTTGNEMVIKGVFPGLCYTIFVVANYSLINAQQPTELQAKSAMIRYTTLGPPPAPILRATTVDLYQVTVEWDVREGHKDVSLSGFRILIDGRPLGETLPKTTRKTTIDSLQPGRTITVQVMACSSHHVGDSEKSNMVRVTCPNPAPQVHITQQPTYKKGSVICAWEKPTAGDHVPYGEDILFYRIFLDGRWHGEVKSNATCNRNGYQYYLTDLRPGQSYDVNVRAYTGQRKVDPGMDQAFCLCESEMSNTLPVTCPAPPDSPCLRLEGMSSVGIDITWEMPQEFGDAHISGYQLMKDGKLYGSIMPADVHSLRIKDCVLGDRIQLQILALTDHPVGRNAEKEKKDKDALTEGAESSIEKAAQNELGLSEVFVGDRYSACKPGPRLIVHYTGLVQPPEKIWCERVCGHSAMIVWTRPDKARQHYVEPESYQVTWWPKDTPHGEIQSQSTKDDHLLVTGLKANTVYNVAVESRKMHSYADIQEGDVQDDGYGNTFILTGQSEQITLRTARPPSNPTNLGILATTCHSILVAWDPPHETGVDILAIRIDAVTMKSSEQNKHSAIEVPADSTSATIENLSEKAEYMITVTAVTEEFFEQLPEGHELRRTHTLPTNKPCPEDLWLPNSSMIAMTSGTDPPTDVRIVKTTINSVTLMWNPPVVYGANRLLGTVVRWAEGKFSKPSNDNNLAHHKSITVENNEVTVEDLHPGILYKIVVEAIVSVKSVIDIDRKDPELEKKNRRTTHVLSKPIFVRTRAPCEPPVPIVSGYNTTTITLVWEKPLLYSIVGKDVNGNPKYLKLSLEGYRLEINGKPHMRLVSTAQSCTLVKCRPGKAYKVVLVALTCTDDVKKERKRRVKGSNLNMSISSLNSSVNREWETSSEDLENDESFSKPLEVILPMTHDGQLSELNASFKLPSDGGMVSDDYCGDVVVQWGIQGENDQLEQFNVSWFIEATHSMQKKVVPANTHHCVIPVGQRRQILDIKVDPQFTRDQTDPDSQRVQVLIPGSPDAPEIFTKSIGREEFIIEWGEPRLYAIKVDGYQVYLNGKKVGGVLSASHRKAVIPCKNKRTYKVNLVAISSDPNFPDSNQSNTLVITTGSEEAVQYLDAPAPQEEIDDQDDSDLHVKITKITENTIHLDWVAFAEPEGMLYYKVMWSSHVQPAEREVKLPAGEKSCVLHKCFPGSVHYVRVWAMGKDDRVMDVSKQLTVQTSASPDTPTVTLRACNFRYIAIEWEKPKTYGDADVSGYKVYVNGVVEGNLGPDQNTFSFTQGKWCREYAFQVQALTNNERLSSKPSDPLVITWPGCQAPILRRVPAVSGNSVKVVWDQPALTEGVSIKHYKVVCLDEDSEKTVQVVSPIHHETTESELHNLKPGSYLVFVEVHIHGNNDVVRSEALRIRPTITPDAPQIQVAVIGLEERRQIEKITCDLINKRDRILQWYYHLYNETTALLRKRKTRRSMRVKRQPKRLLNFLNNKDMLSTMRIVDEDQVIGKVMEDLTHVEDMLDDCLQSLQHYTGHLLAHVSWTCLQSNSEIRVSGYKVLVDGKQYGTTLHSGVKNVRIKLGLQQASHHLSMVSVCDNPHTTSPLSNVVELLTEPFQPFTFFMFLDKPPIGVSFQDTLGQERKSTKGLVNQGLMRRHVAPPSCSIMDLFEGEFRPLFPPSGPRCPTAILFWTKWNVSSKRQLGWFFRFAKMNSSQFEFIAIGCTKGEQDAQEQQQLVQAVTQNGWRDDKSVRHATSPTSSPVADPNGIMLRDISDLFGIVGTPMVVIVHPEDYVAWKGRFCASDYPSFENYMRFIFAQSLNQIPPVADPWDTAIDVDALDGVSKRHLNENQMMIHRPAGNNTRGSMGTSTVHVNGMRPSSGKKLFVKTNQHKHRTQENRINVNQRPFSASSLQSPYKSKAVNERRVKSGRKLKGTY